MLSTLDFWSEFDVDRVINSDQFGYLRKLSNNVQLKTHHVYAVSSTKYQSTIRNWARKIKQKYFNEDKDTLLICTKINISMEFWADCMDLKTLKMPQLAN